MKVVCVKQGLLPQIKINNKDENPKISCYDNKSSNSNVGNKQILYRDHIEKARKHSLEHDCYRLYHLNYGTRVKIDIRPVAKQDEEDREWPCRANAEEKK